MTILGPGLPLTAGTAQIYAGAGINPSAILAAGDPSILAYQATPYALPQYLATDFQNLSPDFDELLSMGSMDAIEANFNLQTQAYQNYYRTGIFGVDPFAAANIYTQTLTSATRQVDSLANSAVSAAGSMFGSLEAAVKNMAPDN